MKRTFTLKDQLDFASLSGDYNPLHVDAIGARRTMFGAPVVHGIHMVLWAIELWLKTHPAELIRLSSVRVLFKKPVRVETEVCYSLKEETDQRVVIDLEGQDGVAARIDFSWIPGSYCDRRVFGAAIPSRTACRSLSDQEVETAGGSLPLYLRLEILCEMFPMIKKQLDPLQVSELLCSTRMVGMDCPGLQSVYSKLEVSFSEADAKQPLNMMYSVKRLDFRFRLVSIHVEGPGMKGTITAFLRPPQKDQPSSEAIKTHVEQGEFSGQCALVIGGSRGLGEVTAKLLAQGGADVFITYYRGKDDAERVVQEISGCGGSVKALPFNILEQKDKLSGCFDERKPSHLYFFATPFIFSATRGVFCPELYDTFCKYYVSGFSKLVSDLDSIGLKQVFYPSSVAVDELPLNMGEYACAKIAGEMLCRYMVKCDPEKIIYLARLRRMDTDQTASILPVDNADPVPLMLALIRAFEAGVAQGNDVILTCRK